jgi:hypothetical protein
MRRKHLEGPTYAPSQVLRWVSVPFEDRQGFAKLASGYRIEWDGLIEEGAKEIEGKIALCKWNARVRFSQKQSSPLLTSHRYLSKPVTLSTLLYGGYWPKFWKIPFPAPRKGGRGLC